MARARNIKPGFFTNEELVDIDPLGRLLFIGLWMLADREGRLDDRPKKIKMEIFPCDNCDVDSLLSQLHDKGFILRYEANEEKYIQIVNFSKHQNPHRNEKPSEIPAPTIVKEESTPEKSSATREMVRSALEMERTTPVKEESAPEKEERARAESPFSDSPNPHSLNPDSLNPESRINIVDVVDSYNSTCRSLPHVQQVTEKRKKAIKARAAVFGINQLKQAFLMAEKSDFLSGRDGKWTNCSFDWLMNEANLVKVLEGTYENKDPAAVPMARGKPTNAIDDFFRRDDCEHRRPESRPTNGCRNLTALTGGVS